MCAATVAVGQPSLHRMQVGKPITNAIRSGEVQRVALTAPTGSFVRAGIQQHGIGVRVRGFFPDGSKIRNFSGPETGVKSIRFVIEIPGEYELELTGMGSGSQQGSYTLVLEQVQSMEERTRIPLPEPFVSPRIQSLADADFTALARFWEETQKTGTPLVDNIATDPEHLLVTFLWRATFETKNVVVLWNPYALEHPEDFAPCGASARATSGIKRCDFQKEHALFINSPPTIRCRVHRTPSGTAQHKPIL